MFLNCHYSLHRLIKFNGSFSERLQTPSWQQRQREGFLLYAVIMINYSIACIGKVPFPLNSNCTRRKTYLSAEDGTCLTINPQVPGFVPHASYRDCPLRQSTAVWCGRFCLTGGQAGHAHRVNLGQAHFHFIKDTCWTDPNCFNTLESDSMVFS